MIFKLPRYSLDSISSLMKSLHWLPFPYRVTYKILILTHNAYHHDSPSYLSALISKKCPSREARTIHTNTLHVPYHSTNAGRRSFATAAPTLWNKLPHELRIIDSLTTFRKHLKTHLFHLAYANIN